MAQKAEEQKEKMQLVTREELIKMSLWERIARIKSELSHRDIKKSGHNKFSNYYYHELSDFMPHITELQATFGVDDTVVFHKEDGLVSITLTNVHKPEETKTTVIPYVEAEMLAKGGAPSTVDAIQRMGSTITYNRRYIYMLAYDIVENDQVDSSDASAREAKTAKQNTPNRPTGSTNTPPKPTGNPNTPPRPNFTKGSSASTAQSNDASVAQTKLVQSLIKQGKLPEDTKTEGLTKKEASDLISSANSAKKEESPLD